MRYKALHNFHKVCRTLYRKKSNLFNHTKLPLDEYKIMSTNTKTLEESKAALNSMFLAGIKAVSPVTIVENNVEFKDGVLSIKDKSFKIEGNVYIVGFGKAVLGMSLALEQILGDSLKKGIVSVPSISKNAIWEFDVSLFPKLSNRVIEYCEGGVNNQPDERALETTHNIIELVEPLTEQDTLIVLISGGGSALLYMPRPVIDQDDKLELCKTLQNAGADIKELNTVRKKLSLVKGGGLARMAYPAQVISLILSDIVGDPIDLIASGPTVYSPKAPEEVVNILRKYNLYGKLQGDLKTILSSKEIFDDKPLLGTTKSFKHVENIILGNNEIAIRAAVFEASKQKLTPVVLRNDITGNVQDVSLAYAHVVSLILLALEKVIEKEDFYEKIRDIPILSIPPNKVEEIFDIVDSINGEGIVLIGAGEPTVIVKGSGKGGRNQELALYFSMHWLLKIKDHPQFSEYDVVIFSGGTDGQDGPTDVAGAFGYPAIGPIMYDLYKQIQKKTTEELARIEAEKVAGMKIKEESQDLCKQVELSGYLNIKKSTPQKPAIEQGESSSVEDTDDAGMEMHPLMFQTIEVERMLPENALKNNDSYNFYSRFKKGADLVKTGITGTNVMDLHFIYIKKRNCSCKIDYTEDSKSENILDTHDLHIDPSTIEKYKSTNRPLKFKWEKDRHKHSYTLSEKTDKINIKIIDDNLQGPCCRKERKFPNDELFKKRKDLYHELLQE